MSAAIPRQTQRLIIARYDDWSGTVEKVSAAEMKRGAEPFVVVPGNGLSIAEYVHDPVGLWPQVTLSISSTKEDSFCAQLQSAYTAQLQDPEAAGNCTIYSYDDDGASLGSIVLLDAVIQSVKFPQGDTGSHSEAMCEVVLQPSSIVTQ